MDIKEVAQAMQDIEFILFSVKNGFQLHPGEAEQAHRKSQEIMEKYLKPMGAFENDYLAEW